MESSKEFEFVRKAGFNSTYAIINKAMYYYESDSEVCCQKYRDVLEAILDDLFKIFDLKTTRGTSNAERITFLAAYIPKEEDFSLLIQELNILRTIGNKYSHHTNAERDPYKDRLTGYHAIRNICNSMVKLPEYIKEEKKKSEEYRKHSMKEAKQKDKVTKYEHSSTKQGNSPYKSQNNKRNNNNKSSNKSKLIKGVIATIIGGVIVGVGTMLGGRKK